MNRRHVSKLTVFLYAVLGLVYAGLSIGAHHESGQKAVLVTGATSGIGLKITEHLADQGVFVYAGARKDADMERLNALENVQAVRLDVNKPADIAAAVTTISEAGRGLHGLVNNAGVAVVWPLIEIPESEFDFQMQVNLYGPYRITRAFAPLIIESKGRITTIGSISGILSGRLFGPYSMSKHAMEAFSDSLAVEMEKFGVAVSVVEPGNFQSKIGENLFKRLEKVDMNMDDSRFGDEMTQFMDYWRNPENTNERADPQPVAAAVEHALFSDNPKARYMVVPVQREAEITVRKAIQEAVQLNHGHEFSFDREQLIKILDEELANVAPAGGE